MQFRTKNKYGDADSAEWPWQRLPLLRMRLLRHLGWQVLEVPFFEWRDLVGNLERQQFLRGHLESKQIPACVKT